MAPRAGALVRGGLRLRPDREYACDPGRDRSRTRPLVESYQLAVRDGTDESKPIHVLTVKLRGAKAGAVDRTVKVVTDLPEEGQVEFHVNAEVLP